MTLAACLLLGLTDGFIGTLVPVRLAIHAHWAFIVAFDLLRARHPLFSHVFLPALTQVSVWGNGPSLTFLFLQNAQASGARLRALGMTDDREDGFSVEDLRREAGTAPVELRAKTTYRQPTAKVRHHRYRSHHRVLGRVERSVSDGKVGTEVATAFKFSGMNQAREGAAVATGRNHWSRERISTSTRLRHRLDVTSALPSGY